MSIGLDEIESDIDKRYRESLDMYYLPSKLAGEVGEACNMICKLHRTKNDSEYYELINKIKLEFADIMFYLVLLAKQYDMDWKDVWTSKMMINDRKYHRMGLYDATKINPEFKKELLSLGELKEISNITKCSSCGISLIESKDTIYTKLSTIDDYCPDCWKEIVNK